MIIHEVGHYIDEKTISSKVWKKVSGWNKSNKKGSLACTLSYYGTSSKYEDFAESITAYRYAPHLFKDCPEKYELLKEKVFGGIEYKTEAQCKR